MSGDAARIGRRQREAALDLLSSIVARRRPESRRLVTPARNASLIRSDVEVLLDVVTDELLEFGLDAEGEHNAYGRQVEDVISVLARLLD